MTSLGKITIIFKQIKVEKKFWAKVEKRMWRSMAPSEEHSYEMIRDFLKRINLFDFSSVISFKKKLKFQKNVGCSFSNWNIVRWHSSEKMSISEKLSERMPKRKRKLSCCYLSPIAIPQYLWQTSDNEWISQWDFSPQAPPPAQPQIQNWLWDKCDPKTTRQNWRNWNKWKRMKSKWNKNEAKKKK